MPQHRPAAMELNFPATNKYVIHFDKDEIPPVNGFWSLSMYNEKILFAANPINRYCLGSLSDPPLIKNPDGSIDIYIQRDSPDSAKMPNWLPSPGQRRLFIDAAPVLATEAGDRQVLDTSGSTTG